MGRKTSSFMEDFIAVDTLSGPGVGTKLAQALTAVVSNVIGSFMCFGSSFNSIIQCSYVIFLEFS